MRIQTDAILVRSEMDQHGSNLASGQRANDSLINNTRN